jgi:signal transduction histidine kinase
MSLLDDTAPDEAAAARDQFRHDLISPLTTISGRAQLLTRTIQRSSALTEPERSALLGGLATIEAAVLSLVTRIDAFGREEADGRIRDAVIVAPNAEDPAP